MEWIETTGKTVAEARELALDQLGVDENEAEFEIVQEPKPGLFGRTRGIARVRARVIPKTPRPKNERKRRPKKKSSGDRVEGTSAGAAPRGKQVRSPKESIPASGRGKGNVRSEAGPVRMTAEKSDTADGAAVRKKESSLMGEEDMEGQSRDADGVRGTAKGDGNDSGRRQDKRAPREPMDRDKQVEVVEQFLIGLLAAFGLEATLMTKFEDKDLQVNVVGEGLGMLVGPRLATLEAVQELTRLALQREAGGMEYARVSVDVAGIREQRRNSLQDFVISAAERARSEGKTVVFEDMSSADRKQVHDLAADIEGVKSVSEGEDPRRRVALVPSD